MAPAQRKKAVDNLINENNETIHEGEKIWKREKPIGYSVFGSIVFLCGVIGSAISITYIAQNILPLVKVDYTPFYIPAYVSSAVPFFFLLMLIEYIFGKKRMSIGGQYEFGDSISSITSGIFQQIGDLLLFRPLAIQILPYIYIYEHYSIYKLELNNWYEWWGMLLLLDMLYYWFHRKAHEINFMWAAHQTHHSTEHYNLTTALSQSPLQSWVSFVFFLPLAFFFPVNLFLYHRQWNVLYQYWVHTTCVRRLGFLEWFMNTPSHHRVHHDRRLHCNYAGTLIIWDRMFGSFKDEGEGFDPVTKKYDNFWVVNSGEHDENVVYGILNPVLSWEPFTKQLYTAKRIWKRFVSNKKISQKIKVLWKGPGARSLKRNTVPPVDTVTTRIRYVAHLSSIAKVYHIYIFTWSLLLAFYTIVFEPKLKYIQVFILCIHVLISLSIQGSLLDGKKFAHRLEIFRCIYLSLISFLLIRYNEYLFISKDLIMYFSMGHIIALIFLWLWPSILTDTYSEKKTHLHLH